MQGKVGAVLAPLGFGLLAIALLGAAGANAVTDAARPSLTLPAAATTNATSSSGAVVSFVAIATDDVQPTSLICAPASGARFAVGTNSVTCTAMDAASHSTSASFAVTVLGAPEQLVLLRTAVIALRLSPGIQQGLLDKLDAAKQSIQGSQSRVACNQLNGFANQVKAQTKKAIADGTTLLSRQNEIEAALDCVKSTAPPVLLGPRADVTTTTAPGLPTATVRFTGSSNSGSCAPTSPATLAVGANTVQCTATNANGTTRTSFVVTVVDQEPPVLKLPADMTVTTPAGSSTAPVDFSVTASDNVAVHSIVCDPPSGTRFGYGATTVTCIATDTSGNTATGTFKVTVNFAISGRITDRDTTLPLADVRAAAFDTVTGNRVNFTASGSDGRYSVVVPPGTYTVLFNGNEAVSYLPQRWNGKRVDQPGDPVTLGGSVGGIDAALVPGYFVHGQVTDASTHQLIGAPGVVVDAVDPALQCCRTISESATAPDGTYRLVVPKGSPVKLQFRPDPSLRYMERWWNGRRNFNEADTLTVNAETFGIDVSLIPAVLISGKVTDDRDGSGIGSVAVVITDSTTPCCPFGGITVTSTASDGTYSVLVPKGIAVKIQFVPSGLADPHFMGEWFDDQPSWDAATIRSFTADTTGISAGLSRGLFISGHIARQDGTAIGGLYANANDGLAGCCHFITGSRTDASGNYHIFVRPGTYKVLFFSRPGFLADDGLTYVDQWWNGAPSFEQGTQIAVSTADVDGVNATMARAVIVSGHVSDASGLVPVVGYQVNAVAATGECCQFVGGAQTNANGDYSIAVPPGMTVKVDFGVFAGPPPGTRYLPQWWNNKTSFDAANPILATTDVPNINARLANGFLITGHVSELGSGRALADVHVEVVDPAVPCCPFRDFANTQTNASGDYAFVVAGGSYKVQFFEFPPPSHPHMHQWWQGKPDDQRADLLVVTGDRPNIDAVLIPAVAIRGHVTDASGTIPVGGLQVNVLDANQPCCQFLGGGQTDGSGNYSAVAPVGSTVKVAFGVFAGTPPGTRYLGQWWNNEPSFDSADTIVMNADRDGIDARLATGFLVSGHVSEPGGAALANVHVQVIDPAVPCCPFREVAHTQTNASGDYNLALPAGSYKVQFFEFPPPAHPHMSQWWQNKPFDQGADLLVISGDRLDVGAVLMPAVFVRGRVIDGNGVGIPQINVSSPNATVPCCQFVAGTQTDGSGNYSYIVPLGSSVKVQFGPPPGSPYVGQWWQNKPDFDSADSLSMTTDRSGIDARLTSGFVISGRVTDASSGLGLEGINVVASDLTRPCCVDVAGTRTGTAGEYQLRVGAGTYRVWFGDPTNGHTPQFWQNRQGGPEQADPVVVGPDRGDINAALVPAVAVSGRVTDAISGNPVAGLFVSAQDANQFCCHFVGGGQTDSQGHYTLFVPRGSSVKVEFAVFGGTPPGTRYLGQWWNNAPSFDAATAINAATSQNTIDAHLEQGFVISGIVRGPGGGPIQNVFVGASLGGAAQCCTGVGGANTDPTGHYRLVLRAGVYRINVNLMPERHLVSQWWAGVPGGTAYFQRATDIVLGPADAPDRDFDLQAGSVISGHVSDAVSGAALGGVGVTANDAGVPCCEGVAFAGTDGAGTYALVVPSGRPVRMFFGPPLPHILQWWDNKPSFEQADNIDTTTDRPGTDARLATGFRITGHVSDRSTGAALANVNVEVIDPRFPCCPFHDAGGANTDASGNYLAIVPAGTYKIAFYPPPGAHYVAELWRDVPTYDLAESLTVNADTSSIDAHLQPAVFIDGVVTDGHTNLPIGGILVQAMRLTPTCCEGVAGTNTDANGHYRLVVPPGTYKLFFGQGIATRAYVAEWWDNKPGFDTADSRLVDTDTVLNVELAPGLFVRGHVTDTAGNPIRGAGVNAYDASLACCLFVGGSGTDQNGDYALTLPPGSYKIQFFPPPGTAFQSQFWNGKPPQFDLADTLLLSGDVSGINAQLTGGFSIRGNVSDRANHIAIANIDVQAYDALVPCCRFLGGTRTNQFGDYTLPLPSAATVKLTFQAIDLTAPAYVQRWWNDKADFAPADQIVVNGNVTDINEVMDAGYKITGRVTDSANPTVGVPDVFVAVQPNVSCCFYGTKTMADGRYIVVVSAATYRISFFSPVGSDFLEQWWNDKFGYATADLVTVPSTTVDLSAINAALVHGIPVAGSVTDSSTGAAVAGVGVVADRDDPPTSCCLSYQARTGADGRYTMYVSAGTYRVNFQPPNTTDYVIEYWEQKPNRDSADLLTVTGPTSGIDAKLDPGFRISGRVTDAATGDPLSFSVVTINPLGCCQAFTVVGTAPDGTYSVLVRAGSYKIGFNPPYGTDFIPQYWDGKPDFASADTLVVNGVQPNINAALAHSSASSGPPSDGTPPAGSGP